MNDRPIREDALPRSALPHSVPRPGMRFNPQTREYEPIQHDRDKEGKLPIDPRVSPPKGFKAGRLAKEFVDAVTRTRPPLPMPPEPIHRESRTDEEEQIPDLPGNEGGEKVCNLIVFREDLYAATLDGVFMLEVEYIPSEQRTRRRWIALPFDSGDEVE